VSPRAGQVAPERATALGPLDEREHRHSHPVFALSPRISLRLDRLYGEEEAIAIADLDDAVDQPAKPFEGGSSSRRAVATTSRIRRTPAKGSCGPALPGSENGGRASRVQAPRPSPPRHPGALIVGEHPRRRLEDPPHVAGSIGTQLRRSRCWCWFKASNSPRIDCPTASCPLHQRQAPVYALAAQSGRGRPAGEVETRSLPAPRTGCGVAILP